MHLFVVFAFGNCMIYQNNNKKNNNNNYHHLIAATATVSILAITIILASTGMVTTPAAATTAATTATTTTPSSPSGVELLPQPIYQERSPEPNITPINQTHAILTFSGSGMLTFSNTTQSINTTSNGTGLISFITSSGYAKETIRTEDGQTATATFYEIVQFDPAANGGGKGIVTAVFQTNSSGTLAPLNGVIAAGIDDMTSSGESHVTLWKWESGISSSNNTNNSTGIAAPLPVQGESPMNAPTTTTNATTAATTNATGANEGEGGEQQTTPSIPAPLLE
jgi:hypothetical protein